jgi:FkbH-like protein
MQVPFLDLRRQTRALQAELEEAIRRVLDAGQFILGPELERFEAEWAAYCGAEYCIGVGNGLEALYLALRAMGVGPGAEVIVPAHTYVATWLAVSWCGARPVPVDVDPRTGMMDVADLEAAITARTRVIIPVHLYGLPADLDPIRDLALRYGLRVLEDAAQAHGARYRGRRIGAHGDAVAWSFYPSKNLGAIGDGGAVTTSDPELARRLRLLRHYGSPQRNVHQIEGINSRLDPLQAAVLRTKLRHLEAWNERRRELAGRYREAFADLEAELALLPVPEWAEPVWHLFVVRHRRRDELQRLLAERGVESLVHYPTPPHLQPVYAHLGLGPGALPGAEQMAREVLSLPLDPFLEEEELQYVIASVREAVAQLASKGGAVHPVPGLRPQSSEEPAAPAPGGASGRVPDPASESAELERDLAIETLFAARPRRAALLRLPVEKWPLRGRIQMQVWRNHAFEPLLRPLEAYLRFAGFALDVHLSAYDDSLSWADPAPEGASLELVYLDRDRYRIADAEFLDWLRERIALRRRASQLPMLVLSWLAHPQSGDPFSGLVDVHWVDLGAFFAEEAPDLVWRDPDLLPVAGTRLRNEAQLLLARALAGRWIGGLVLPPIKAIAVDLDGTLYDGVLAEDGVEGIRISPAHRELQAFLERCARSGLFVALVTRNHPEDVLGLLQGEGFPLRGADLAAVLADWRPKSVLLHELAQRLRIGLDSILFVDDNPGELIQVARDLPEVHRVHAADPERTRRTLRYYPGLWRWHPATSENALRVRDWQSLAVREALRRQLDDLAAYWGALQTRLSVSVNEPEDFPRIAELLQKTNQFNLTLARSSLAVVDALACDPRGAVVGVRLRDRLADSGLVAALLVEQQGDGALVRELAISCRALGRGLEEAMVFLALRAVPFLEQTTRILFPVRPGPRNEPVRRWLKSVLELEEIPQEGLYALPSHRVLGWQVPEGLQVEEAIHGEP